MSLEQPNNESRIVVVALRAQCLFLSMYKNKSEFFFFYTYLRKSLFLFFTENKKLSLQ